MSNLVQIDELKIYRGGNFCINDDIKIKQPTLGEICDYGEQSYFSMIHTLCAVGADLKWQLDDLNIDYTTISDFDLFCIVLSRNFTNEQTSILFGNNIDFSKMQLKYHTGLDENVLVQQLDNKYIIIDRHTYFSIVEVLRKMHKFKRNDEIPGNEETKKILIDDAREEFEDNKNKPYKSFLLSLVSTMVNSEGFKRDETTLFDMKICAFMDSVARISKIKNAELLLQSGYSGFGIDLKKINKEELNWLGELN